MALLLIGSTGNGKSTLGNFLLDPTKEHLFRKQTFKTAQANLPETQNVKDTTKLVKYSESEEMIATVIDTPGLNENAERDLHHMIQIVERLQKLDSVKACIFVVKFNSKIDAQYRSTVQYYSKLLPSLFERNVIVVMTEYANDERSMQLREMQGIDANQVMDNTRKELVVTGGLSYDPMLFAMDCLPIGEEEWEVSMRIRDAFFQYVDQLEPFSSTSFAIAKTPYIVAKDNEKASLFDGEIKGYNVRLMEANKLAQKCLEEEEDKGREMTEMKKVIKNLENRIEQLDTNDNVTAASWSQEISWKLFKTLEREYTLTSQWKIQNVKRWNNGKCTWKDELETDHCVKGKVKGRFMRGLYATLTLETMKKEKYAEEISEERKKLAKSEHDYQQLHEELMTIQKNHKQYIEDLRLLESFIEDRSESIACLSSEYMSVTEAKDRLQELQKIGKEIVST